MLKELDNLSKIVEVNEEGFKENGYIPISKEYAIASELKGSKDRHGIGVWLRKPVDEYFDAHWH
jgi:hypothetical protein